MRPEHGTLARPVLDAQSRKALTEQVLQAIQGREAVSDEELRQAILLTVAHAFSGSRYSFSERQAAAGQLFNAMRGLDLLQPLVDDPEITEIMVNGPGSIYIEKQGLLKETALSFDSAEHLTGVIANFFGRANRQIHEKRPLADMRLPDGSRVHAALPPAAPDGPVLTIRKFSGLRPDMRQLIETGFVTQEAADYLAGAIRDRKTLFLCGGTGSGKTTFLNILASCIPEHERVITIEDAAELSLKGLEHVVRLEARLPGPDGSGEITLAELIRASLRMRPDRIIVGEVRGREAFDMLQAMNTGHPGSLCTGHANSCQDMVDRLSLMVLMAVQMPWDAIRSLVASALDIMVFLKRTGSGARIVQEIAVITQKQTGLLDVAPVFIRDPRGRLTRV